MAAKTKLLKTQRDTMIARIVQDIPRVDYDAIKRDLVEEALHEQLPPAIREIVVNRELAEYIESHQIRIYDADAEEHEGSGYRLYSRYHLGALYFRPSENLRKALADLCSSANTQRKAIKSAEAEVSRALNSCRTHEDVRERFPAFADYLPKKAPEPIRNAMVSITDPAEALRKLGWPRSASEGNPVL